MYTKGLIGIIHGATCQHEVAPSLSILSPNTDALKINKNSLLQLCPLASLKSFDILISAHLS